VTDPFVGQTLNGYEITRYKGQGAFSLVYEANHVASGTPVAIKLLKPGAVPEQIREFDNEGDLLVALSGAANVVNILDTQTCPLTVTLTGSTIPMTIVARFHVLELADGCLDELVARIDQIPWNERLSLYRDVVLGVHQMHCGSVVHRDVKSSNCLLFEKPMQTLMAKVNDLGRARDLRRSAIASAIHYRTGRGDPNFMPPELLWQLGRDDAVTHRSADLYGLGSLMYELVTGQGLTSVAIFPRAHVLHADLALPDARRSLQYRARHDELRSWIESALAIAEPGIPKAITWPTVDLIRQLCNPDPLLRFPKVIGGKRRPLPADLNWLLRRTDILIKTLSNAEAQRIREGRKKARS